ncbi:DUF6916 family protein [Veronia pacifica]|uniref:DUF6916 domain-containing protein n=1 Tax=Veronia pacifica TaxID=1080227 RepID=A0A1C3EQY2_9GAMM|nr:hypothetical protein [Veronia pacifica]ODA35654.1 hypothetical protein A8L45_03305 [Veronia pacifica]
MNVLSWENISKLEGQNVMVLDGAENEFDVLIESVLEHEMNGEVHEGRNVERYTIVLLGPNHAEFPQGNYIVSHPSMGQQILYMIPGEENRYSITIDTTA